MISTDKAYEALEDDKGAKDDGKSISAPGLNVGRNDGIQVGLTYESPALSVVRPSSQQEAPPK